MMRSRAGVVATLSALTLLVACQFPAFGDDGADVTGHAASDAFALEGNKAMDGTESAPEQQVRVPADSSGTPTYVKYRWASVCATAGPSSNPGDSPDCGQAHSCPKPNQRLWRLWGQRLSGDWDALTEQCAGPQGPPPAATPKPQVTPGLVLTELRRIGLPALQARTQPRDKTLVNFATIFYAEPQSFTRTLTLLGQSVDVEAEPTSYTWHYGDGSSATTSTPGAPYPAKDVTHSYTDAHTTVQPSVDVTYAARFRVGNGAWQTIPDSVTIAGPAALLRISEATAVLSGEYH
jgi:hypothetical protein